MAKKTAKRKSAAAGAEPSRQRARPSQPDAGGEQTAFYVTWGIRAAVVAALAIAAWIIVPPYLAGMKAKPIWDEAVQLASAQRYEEAIPKYQRAYEIAPKYIGEKYADQMGVCYRGLGQQQEAAGQYAQAAESYARALQLDPKVSARKGINYRLATCYNHLNQKKKALAYARREVEAGGEHAALADSMVRLLEQKTR